MHAALQQHSTATAGNGSRKINSGREEKSMSILCSVVKAADMTETHPLEQIFVEGKLYSNWEEFKKNFKVDPPKFKCIEHRLRTRCKDYGITYIAPKLTDSVETTIARKAALNRAIETAAQKNRREQMSESDRKAANAREVVCRRKRRAQESLPNRETCLAYESKNRRKLRECAFEAECRKQKVRYISPQMMRPLQKKIRSSFRTSSPNNEHNNQKGGDEGQLAVKKSAAVICEECKMGCNTGECCGIRPPQKIDFRVTRKGIKYSSYGSIRKGVEYSYGSICFGSEYISPHAEIADEIYYWDRNIDSRYEHMFCLTFSQKRACPINEVLSARVWIIRD